LDARGKTAFVALQCVFEGHEGLKEEAHLTENAEHVEGPYLDGRFHPQINGRVLIVHHALEIGLHVILIFVRLGK
jgi:hypothetical protein